MQTAFDAFVASNKGKDKEKEKEKEKDKDKDKEKKKGIFRRPTVSKAGK